MRKSQFFYAIIISLFLSAVPLPAAELTADDIVARNLQSIGPQDALKNIKSRVAEGGVVYKVLSGGSGQLHGKAVFVSQGAETHLMLKVLTNQYLGERLICNGGRTSVATAYADKTYSEFGDFLKGQDAPIREGLLGGVLTTAWPLLDLDSRKAKLSYEGLKKINGVELHSLRYKSKKSTDLNVMLYFDPQSFRHVLTIYTLSIAPRIGAVETESARMQETRYRIEERYGNFGTVDGITLPSHYELRFTAELTNGFTKSVEWDVDFANINNNVQLDPRNFEIK